MNLLTFNYQRVMQMRWSIYEDDDAIAWAIHGPDAAEGNKAFFEKRPADWVAVDPTALPHFGKRNANPFGNS